MLKIRLKSYAIKNGSTEKENVIDDTLEIEYLGFPIESKVYNLSSQEDCEQYYNLLNTITKASSSWNDVTKDLQLTLDAAYSCRQNATFDDFCKFNKLIGELKANMDGINKNKDYLRKLYCLLDAPWSDLIAHYDYTDERKIEIEVDGGDKIWGF